MLIFTVAIECLQIGGSPPCPSIQPRVSPVTVGCVTGTFALAECDRLVLGHLEYYRGEFGAGVAAVAERLFVRLST